MKRLKFILLQMQDMHKVWKLYKLAQASRSLYIFAIVTHSKLSNGTQKDKDLLARNCKIIFAKTNLRWPVKITVSWWISLDMVDTLTETLTDLFNVHLSRC